MNYKVVINYSHYFRVTGDHRPAERNEHTGSTAPKKLQMQNKLKCFKKLIFFCFCVYKQSSFYFENVHTVYHYHTVYKKLVSKFCKFFVFVSSFCLSVCPNTVTERNERENMCIYNLANSRF
jgi:hypothetical protein